MGKRKRPFYRLVAMDNRKQRDGKYLANLGYYNPFVEPFVTQLHDDEIIAWLKRGATVSATARSLLKLQGLLYRFSLERQGLAAEEIGRKLEAWREGNAARVATRAQVEAERKASRAEAAAKAAKAKADAEAASKAAAEAPAAPAAEAESSAPVEAPAEGSPAEASPAESPAAEGGSPADAG